MDIARYLQIAFDEASKSDASHHHGAVLVKKKHIVSTGHSQNKTHPILKKYSDIIDKLHAEIHAILRAKINDLSGSVMYVVRRRRKDLFGLSRPCDLCMKIMNDYNIGKIIYSNSDGTYDVLENK